MHVMYAFVIGIVIGAVLVTPAILIWIKSEFVKLHDKFDAYEAARKNQLSKEGYRAG